MYLAIAGTFAGPKKVVVVVTRIVVVAPKKVVVVVTRIVRRAVAVPAIAISAVVQITKPRYRSTGVLHSPCLHVVRPSLTSRVGLV